MSLFPNDDDHVSYGEEIAALVPDLLAQEKYFDISCDEIQEELKAGRADIKREVFVDVSGETIVIWLRLNFTGLDQELPVRWKASLKAGGKRIAGLDHEPDFTDMNGQPAQGWHRHVWCSKTKQAESLKESVSVGATTVSQFIHGATRMFGVVLSA